MKKFVVLLSVLALLFVGTAFAEVVEFPNGLTVDVAPGWEYSGEGENITLIAEDKSCAITIVVTDPQGMTADVAAKAFSDQHKGSAPEQIGDNTYTYTFKGGNAAETKVIVGIEDGKLMVLSVTGDHQDAGEMINSIKEK